MNQRSQDLEQKYRLSNPNSFSPEGNVYGLVYANKASSKSKGALFIRCTRTNTWYVISKLNDMYEVRNEAYVHNNVALYFFGLKINVENVRSYVEKRIHERYLALDTLLYDGTSFPKLQDYIVKQVKQYNTRYWSELKTTTGVTVCCLTKANRSESSRGSLIQSHNVVRQGCVLKEGSISDTEALQIIEDLCQKKAIHNVNFNFKDDVEFDLFKFNNANSELIVDEKLMRENSYLKDNEYAVDVVF